MHRKERKSGKDSNRPRITQNPKNHSQPILKLALPVYLFGLIGLLLSIGPETSKAFSGWDEGNDPRNMRFFTRKHFNSLPLKAFLKDQPWSGDYWPTYKGGLSYRWASPARYDKNRWNYVKPGRGVVTNNLSPIEKYDLYVGNKNFELTHLERRGPYLQQEKF